jgi:hypothetical protein
MAEVPAGVKSNGTVPTVPFRLLLFRRRRRKKTPFSYLSVNFTVDSCFLCYGQKKKKERRPQQSATSVKQESGRK